MSADKKKIGIIGFGNMGSAIAARIKHKYEVFVFDKDRQKIQDVANPVLELADLVKKVDTVILAVKPQDFEALLADIRDYARGKLIISIAAGINTGYVEKCLPGARLVRVMPNMPARVGMGMSCLCKGKFASVEDLNSARELFNNLGKTLILSEDMMDAATAVSGSGPGYFYALIEGKNVNEAKKYLTDTFIPALKEAAVAVGFTVNDAEVLAEATGIGSMSFLAESHLLPAELKKQVASRGGTTEAGLEVLDKSGSLTEAVQAAAKRAKSLSL